MVVNRTLETEPMNATHRSTRGMPHNRERALHVVAPIQTLLSPRA
jgi:hypothetical protein